MTRVLVRPARSLDAARIAAIYNHYVLNTVVTFEEKKVSSKEMARRIRDVAKARLPWIVAEEAGRLVGYAYAAPWKARSAYRFSVETTVYLAPGSEGKGLGTRLYEALFARLKERSIHAAIGGIALPNPASVALHEKLGMRHLGTFTEVGFKFGRWVDVGYWQRRFRARPARRRAP